MLNPQCHSIQTQQPNNLQPEGFYILHTNFEFNKIILSKVLKLCGTLYDDLTMTLLFSVTFKMQIKTIINKYMNCWKEENQKMHRYTNLDIPDEIVG